MALILQLLDFLLPYGMYAYGFMLGLLLACGFGFPMPEDVILVTSGMLASRHVVDLVMTNILCLVGVLVGDGTVFCIGYRLGPKLKQMKFYRSLMKNGREEKVDRWFKGYGDRVIFFARFTPGLRMPLFLTAGMYHVSFWKFLCLDGLAALISVPLWIWVGYFFGQNLELLEQKMTQFQLGIYALLALVIIGFLVRYLRKKNR